MKDSPDEKEFYLSALAKYQNLLAQPAHISVEDLRYLVNLIYPVEKAHLARRQCIQLPSPIKSLLSLQRSDTLELLICACEDHSIYLLKSVLGENLEIADRKNIQEGIFLGFDVPPTFGGYSVAPRFIILPQGSNRPVIFEIQITHGYHLELHHISSEGLFATLENTALVARLSGKLTPMGLSSLRVIRQPGNGVFSLSGVNILNQIAHHTLPARPLAAVFTPDRVFLGLRGEILDTLRWDGTNFVGDPNWHIPEAPFNGEVRSLAIVYSENNEEWILAATNERMLFVLGPDGKVHDAVQLPHSLTAIEVTRDGFWLADKVGQLCHMVPAFSPFARKPLPKLAEVIRFLPSPRREKVAREWFASEKPAACAAAAELLCIALQERESWAEAVLEDVRPKSAETARAIISCFERCAAAQDASDHPVTLQLVNWMGTFTEKSNLEIQQIILLSAARLIAHFGAVGNENPPWAHIRDLRRKSDHERLDQRAISLPASTPIHKQLAALTSVLEGYAETLHYRRIIVWSFAIEDPIRAILSINGCSELLAATRKGQIFHINHELRRVISQESSIDPADGIPTAMVSLSEGRIFLATKSGSIYEAFFCDTASEPFHPAGNVPGDIQNLASIPTPAGQPYRIAVGSGEGRVCIFQNSENGDEWQKLREQSLDAEEINTLFVCQVEEGFSPSILAGGSDSSGQGCLFILNSDTLLTEKKLVFDAPVLDVKVAGSDIALVCNDGFVYLIRNDGRLLWRCRVGLAARNIDVFDLSGNGVQELIVGGETTRESDGNHLLVLGLDGLSRWIMPTSAPVTHVQAFTGIDGAPHLLVTGMDKSLQIIKVIPPGSKVRNDVKARATSWLDRAITASGSSRDELLRTWLYDQTQPELQSFACYELMESRREQMPQDLIEFDPTICQPVVQRAFLRNLVSSIKVVNSSNSESWEIRDRLKELIANPKIIDYAVMSALREIAMMGEAISNEFDSWRDILLEASHRSLPEIRHTCLMLLGRMLHRNDQLPGEAWEIIQAAIGLPDHFDSWIAEDIALLLRQVAPDAISLWHLFYQALGYLKAPAVLTIFEKNHLNRLDEQGIEQAIYRLGRIAIFETQAKLPVRLKELSEALSPSRAPLLARTEDPYLQAYRLMGMGAALSTADEWKRFVSDLLPSGGLRSLQDTLRIVEPADRLLMNQYTILMDIVHQFNKQPVYLESLMRLEGDLSRIVQNLLEDCEKESGEWISPGLASLAGMLITWTEPENGLLKNWIDDLRRPIAPMIKAGEVSMSRNEITLIAELINPSQGTRIEELVLFLNSVSFETGNGIPIKISGYLADAGSQDSLTLQPMESRRLEIHLPLKDADVNQLHFDANEHLQVTLSIPVAYYIPSQPLNTETKPVTTSFRLDRRSLAALNLERDLPAHWQKIRKTLDRLIREKEGFLLHLECASLIRTSLVNILGSYTEPNHSSSIDLQNWVIYVQSDLGKQRNLQVTHANMLAWLASQVWPNANQMVNDIRKSGSPSTTFFQVAETQPHPRILVFNQWDRMVEFAAQHPNQWSAFDGALIPFFSWCHQKKIVVVLIGSYLSQLVTTTRWPQLKDRLVFYSIDRIDAASSTDCMQLEEAIRQLLKDLHLQRILNDFNPTLTAQQICEWSGANLQVVDFMFEALGAVQREVFFQSNLPLDYFLSYAKEKNYFSSWWIWQEPYARILLAFASIATIALERGSQAEAGMILAEDFYIRHRAGKGITTFPFFPAEKPLSDADAKLLRDNAPYQEKDPFILGFLPYRAQSNWEKSGEMWMQMLSSAGEGVITELVQDGLLSERHTRSISRFYEIAIPLYRHWLLKADLARFMIRAAEDGQGLVYPSYLFRTGERSHGSLLFEDRKPRLIYQDLPITQLVQINSALKADTRLLFMRLFGLSDVNTRQEIERWNKLVDLSGRLRTWFSPDVYSFGNDAVGPMADDLAYFFHLEIRDGEKTVSEIYHQGNEDVYWMFSTELGGSGRVLDEKVIFIVIHNDQVYDTNQIRRLRAHITEEFKKLRRSQGSRKVSDRKKDRPNVAFLITPGSAFESRRSLDQIERLSPFMVLLTPDLLSQVLVDTDPTRALVRQAFKTTKRSPFSPYQLGASLDGDSRLFVGREEQIEMIMQTIDQQHYVIVGSRKIGKTSLLARIQWLLQRKPLEERHICLFLRLGTSTTEDEFYGLIRAELMNIGRNELANSLALHPNGNFSDLLTVMQTLQNERGRPVVILIDEVDALYFHDFYQHHERLFQFLRSNLAQNHMCTFIMTGYYHVYMKRSSPASVFYNFCRFVRLFEVNREDVDRLVTLISEFDVNIVKPDEVLGAVMEGTYGIPYLVQNACHQILERLDAYGLDELTPETVQVVVDQKLRAELINNYWVNLEIEDLMAQHEPEGLAESKERQILKIKILLLIIVLERYTYMENEEMVNLPLLNENRYFSADDIVKYAREHVEQSLWVVNPEEVNRLLRSATMLLILRPDEENNAYSFTNDILPRLLYAAQRQKRIDLIAELFQLKDKLEQTP